MSRIMTFDAGTTGLKASLFEADGTLVASRVKEYPVSMPRQGWMEQAAETFIEAMLDAGRDIILEAGAKDIAVIGLSGTMNGLIPVDARGEALYPNMIHADTRATDQLEAIRARVSEDEYYARTGNRIDVHYMLPKLLWLRENLPDVFRRTRWVVNTKDALYAFLTGRPGMTDYSDASLTGLFNLGKRAWDRELVDAFGLPAHILPEVRPSADTTGHLTREAARLLGLPSGIPVAVGAGDGACATHGAGLFSPEGAYCSIGSSAWVEMLAEAPVRDPSHGLFCYIDMDEHYYSVCGTVQSAASAFDWARSSLFGTASGDLAHMERLCCESAPGAGGVFFLPMLAGERTPWWDPDARAVWIGMHPATSLPDMVRSVYEGIAQALNQCARQMRRAGLDFDRLMLIGGGARSAVWPVMLADMLGTRVRVHRNPRAATSLGALIAAGVGVGLYPGFAEACRVVRVQADCLPNADNADLYGAQYAIYHSLYQSLRDPFGRISEFQRGLRTP